MVNDEYDVLIVGAGPAGISTWLHLHKYHPDLAKKALVIDKAVFPRDKICGGAVGVWSMSILNDLNIQLDIPMLSISKMKFVFDSQKLELDYPNIMMMVLRFDFDNALVENAKKRGLTFHENEVFKDFKRSDDSLIVSTDKGEYRVKILVGGDGSLSKVRKKINLPNKNHIAPTLELFHPVNPQVDHEYKDKQILIDLNPIKKGIQGYVWHLPCIKDDEPCICHGIGNLRVYPSESDSDLKTIFSEELKIRNINQGVKSWSGHPIRCFRPGDIISSPNVLLVGDAAGIEPAFGGGIHFALSYGDLAARTIIDSFKHDDFSFQDYEKKMSSHIVGKTLAYCTNIAHEMYAGRMNPLDAAKKVFSVRK